MNIDLYTMERDRTRIAVNEWIQAQRGFDGVVDFGQAVRDWIVPHGCYRLSLRKTICT